jgi:YggT family protein
MSVVSVVLCWALFLYWVILIARIILSWVPSLPEPLLPAARLVRAATDPLLLPLRGLLPPVQVGAVAFDLSILLLFFALSIVRGLLCSGIV